MPIGDYIGDVVGDLTPDLLDGPGAVQTPTEIFGAALIAWWDFADSDSLTFSGSDVTLAENKANPGTYRLTSPNPPVFVAGGLDGRDCAEFDGSNEYMEHNGFPGQVGDTWDFYCVMQWTGAVPPAAAAYCIYGVSGLGGSQVSQTISTSGGGLHGMEYRSTPGGYASGTAGAVDASPKLIATTTYNSGGGASSGKLWVNGVNVLTLSTGQDGTFGAVARIVIGGVLATLNAPMRASEVVVVRNEVNGEANRLAYQARIAALYPTIGAALP